MKVTTIIMTVFMLQVTAVTKAQISLNMKSATLRVVLEKISQQSGYDFIYSDKDIKASKPVTVKLDNVTIETALKSCFEGQPLIYELSEKTVLVRRANQQPSRPTANKVTVIEIRGIVADEKGLPLPGVTIKVKDEKAITTSNENGKYQINIANENAILIFSSVGYLSQEIVAGNRTLINVNLKAADDNLQEVVVVGYGVQKKANLTGAITTVSNKELESRPVTNAAQALQGKVGNLNIVNGDGGPGKKASFNIRGYAGLGASYTPLVIVDGVTGYLDDLNPSDIETLTVLKDASASAIYGAQAAYGVILVTTKSGKKGEKAVINYNNNFSYNSPTLLPKTAGSLEFAKLFREASINEGGGGVIDLETMDRIQQYYENRNSIPNDVPQINDPQRWADWGDGRSNANEDWSKAMFKNQINQLHNLSVKGGSELTTYFMSLGYTGDEGKLRYYDDDYKRINLNAKISSDVNKWLTLGLNFRYANENAVSPAYYMEPNGGINSLIGWINVVWPTIPVMDPNGHFSPAGRMAFINQANPNTTTNNNLWTTGTALFKIGPGLTGNANITYNNWGMKQTYSRGLIYSYSVSNEPYLDSSSPETTQIWQNTNNDDFISSNAYLTYEKNLADHHFKVMGGAQQEYKKIYGVSANKKGLVIPSMPSLSTATGAVVATDQLDHWATLGFFGRLNYDFKGKYLLELNIRRDGSSRYPDESIAPGSSKWGTFPSISAGWNIAKEDFFPVALKTFQELKLRGSWGELGNMRGKSYQYLSTIPYNAAYPYIMGNQLVGTLGTPSLIAYNTWERNRTLNFGLDVVLLKGNLSASLDWYQRDIIGLITKGVTVSAVLGATSPETNNADIRNRGWEFTLSWNDKVDLGSNQLRYGLQFNLSDYKGFVTKYSNPKGLLTDWYGGQQMGDIWGYTTDHIMTDAAEAEQVNTSKFQQRFGANWTRGDMKYKDLDNSGFVDNGSNTLDDHGDLSVIGNNTPRYSYGFGINAELSGFDLNVFLQGVGKRDLWLSGVRTWGLGGGQWGSNVWENTLDTWREDGSNMDPYWPKLYLSSTSKNLQTQTKYLSNGAYCRIKNIQVGYTVPSKISNRIAVQKLRIFFSGENLLTFSKINENFDPEVPTGNVYPLSKSLSLGLNLTF